MASRYPILYRSIQLIAIIFALAGYLFPTLLLRWELILAVVLIALIGIPHGATDHLIFRNLTRPFLGTRQMIYFYSYYLLLIGAYAALWWFFPVLSFALFLVLSAYHFGQSNWNYVQFASKFSSGIYYLLWGGFVIIAPVLLHYDSTLPIIQEIVRQSPPLIEPVFRWGIVGTVLGMNILLTLLLRWQQKLSARQLTEELISLLVLSLVFYFTPVLLGFAIYFVCWHSMSSVMDQIQFFQERKSKYSLKKYVGDTLPFTLLALFGLAALFWAQQQFLGTMQVGLLFIFISIVTLPHMILIDRLYEEAEKNKSMLKG
jgi:Brp/Blh family beta-carotene 15,15'-monooxygenase